MIAKDEWGYQVFIVQQIKVEGRVDIVGCDRNEDIGEAFHE